MMKRFFVSGVTRDKAYDLTKGSPGSKVLYLTVNPNGEAEVLTMHLKAIPKVKNLVFEDLPFDWWMVEEADVITP